MTSVVQMENLENSALIHSFCYSILFLSFLFTGHRANVAVKTFNLQQDFVFEISQLFSRVKSFDRDVEKNN